MFSLLTSSCNCRTSSFEMSVDIAPTFVDRMYQQFFRVLFEILAIWSTWQNDGSWQLCCVGNEGNTSLTTCNRWRFYLHEMQELPTRTRGLDECKCGIWCPLSVSSTTPHTHTHTRTKTEKLYEGYCLVTVTAVLNVTAVILKVRGFDVCCFLNQLYRDTRLPLTVGQDPVDDRLPFTSMKTSLNF